MGPCHHGMARLQLADGGDSLQICRVSTIVGGALEAPFVFCEGQGISSTANKKKCLSKGKLLKFCDFTFDTRTKPYNGPGSSVGIATAYGLDDPGIESR